MEHSAAIMEDAGNAIDGAAKPDAVGTTSPSGNEDSRQFDAAESSDQRQNNYSRRKRKSDFGDSSMHHGSRGGNDAANGNNKRHKKGNLGRGEYLRSNPDKREKTNASREAAKAGKAPQYGTKFSQAEIDAEERRPKRKVAVLIGYSGTGYKGMQISSSEKTIEGDLFNAFVAAGAISKANADDPKKASLVRCARTDKGVHAAGNMISLKLIVEDEDIVQKINENLSPQIRVWGIERTIGSFSCYQACDSRWYEYLIPSHAFLPPHPSSWMAKKIEQYADEIGDREAYDSRQAEVKDFWTRVDETEIKPVLASIDEDIRSDVIRALQGEDEASATIVKDESEVEKVVKLGSTLGNEDELVRDDEKTEEAAIIINDSALAAEKPTTDSMPKSPDGENNGAATNKLQNGAAQSTIPADDARQKRLRDATRMLRETYNQSKRRYRIPQKRIDRIQELLSGYVGTLNFHNYTIQKAFADPSAKRHIKSFVVNPTPILIGDGPEQSEWLSLKVHGQSFMMHQIRKMVSMVTLLVRCGSNPETLKHSFTDARYSIPKVPGLGLLLERPVFDSYNTIQAVKHDRPTLDFFKFNADMEAFKQREIYQRIFREEEEGNDFGKFFNHIDNFKDPHFLFVTSKGIEATKIAESKDEA